MGQCLAELAAAQKLNGNPACPVYGIVTDGESWRFGRLVGNLFTQNQESGTDGDLPELFGFLFAIFEAAACAVNTPPTVAT